MKYMLLSGLAVAGVLLVFDVPANAQMTSLSNNARQFFSDHNANLIKAGMRAKKRSTNRHRRRTQGSGKFKGNGGAASMGPLVPPIVIDMAIRRKKCLESARLPVNGCPMKPK